MDRRTLDMCFMEIIYYNKVKDTDQLDSEMEKQFSAVTFLMDNETAYVAYRGTDATLVRWKIAINSMSPKQLYIANLKR